MTWSRFLVPISIIINSFLTSFQVRLLLEEPNSPSEAKPFHMARDVYKACMDLGRIEDTGTDGLKRILDRLGGWPVLEGDAWSEANPNYLWYEQIFRFREMGYSVDYFVDFSVTTDLKNSSRRILDLDQPGLGMSREYLIKGAGDEDVNVRPFFFIPPYNLFAKK